jgi:nicotinate phosphoribosyltransferase
MSEDLVGLEDEVLDGDPLLLPAMRDGQIVSAQTMEDMRVRSRLSIRALPVELRSAGEKPEYPVRITNALRNLATRGEERGEKSRGLFGE